MKAANSKGLVSHQPNMVKRELHDAIKSNDYDKVESVVVKYNIDGNEEISSPGYQWGPIHYAIHFKTPKILEYLLLRTYSRHAADYADILNAPSKDGWTPLMIAGIYGSIDCLRLLLKYGGIYSDVKDSNGKSAAELAEYYGAIPCFEILKALPKGFLPIKIEQFKDAKVEPANFETIFKPAPTLDELYINGTLKPCIYCDSNIGYIRYSKCCGTPMHKACLKEKDLVCKGCLKNDTEVHGKIVFPEKAFEGYVPNR